VPYGGSEGNWVNDIADSKRPPRPTDSSQKRWLNDRIWDVITTCWDGRPQWRCELSVVHHAFSTPNRYGVLAEFPPVNRENLLQLAEELLHVFLVLPLGPHQRATLRKVQEYISNVISKDGASPSILSSAKAAAFIKTRQEVFLPCYISPQFLKHVVVRRIRSYCPPCHVLRFVYGSEFIPTPSSSTCKYSQT
jgi:hypothetical protein